MVEIKMFNHGIFQEEIQTKLQELNILKSKELDPYMKWNYIEQIKLVTGLLQSYKDSVKKQL